MTKGFKKCDDGHEEIYYKGTTCPLCEAIDSLWDSREQIDLPPD